MIVGESVIMLDYQVERNGGFVLERILVDCVVEELVILKHGLQMGM